MTIPISPVNINPQLIGGNEPDGFALLIQALQHRRALDMQKQKLAQDQEEFELNKKLTGKQMAGMEIVQEEKKREILSKIKKVEAIE